MVSKLGIQGNSEWAPVELIYIKNIYLHSTEF